MKTPYLGPITPLLTVFLGPPCSKNRTDHAYIWLLGHRVLRPNFQGHPTINRSPNWAEANFPKKKQPTGPPPPQKKTQSSKVYILQKLPFEDVSSINNGDLSSIYIAMLVFGKVYSPNFWKNITFKYLFLMEIWIDLDRESFFSPGICCQKDGGFSPNKLVVNIIWWWILMWSQCIKKLTLNRWFYGDLQCDLP